MNNAYNMVRRTSNTLGMLIMLLVSIVMIAVGCFIGILSQKNTYAETTAQIVNIETYYDYTSQDNQYSHNVFVTYEVDGVKYEYRELGSYSSTMDVGEEITIRYNVDDPNDIEGKGAQFAPYIFMGIGVLLLIISVANLIKLKKARGGSADSFASMAANYRQPAENTQSEGHTEKFSYVPNGHIGKGFRVTDEANQPALEAQKVRSGFFCADFEFYNHRTMRRQTFKVGSIVSSGMVAQSSAEIMLNAYFKLNGQKVWQYFEERGYTFSVRLNGFESSYELFRNGQLVAKLTPDYSGSLFDQVSSRRKYFIECDETELDMAALLCFAIGRVNR